MILYQGVKGELEFLKSLYSIHDTIPEIDSKEERLSLKRVEEAIAIYEFHDSVYAKEENKLSRIFMGMIQKFNWCATTAKSKGYATTKIAMGKENLTITTNSGYINIALDVIFSMTPEFIYEIEFTIKSITLCIGSDVVKYKWNAVIYFCTNSTVDLDAMGIIQDIVKVASSIIVGREIHKEEFIPVFYPIDRRIPGIIGDIPFNRYTYKLGGVK